MGINSFTLRSRAQVSKRVAYHSSIKNIKHIRSVYSLFSQGRRYRLNYVNMHLGEVAKIYTTRLRSIVLDRSFVRLMQISLHSRHSLNSINKLKISNWQVNC